MCRSATKTIGFLLLLWMGIFLPITEYQMSHASDVGSIAAAASGDDDDTADEPAHSDAQHDSSDRYTGFASLDLSEITLAVGPPDLTLKAGPLPATRIAEGFKSRALPPQERPPNSAAA